MIFKKLLGMGGGGATPAKKTVEYKGYAIVPAPKKAGAHYYTAGYIRKTINNEAKEKYFVRADTYSNTTDACENAINKGRRIIDEQGDKLFD